MFKDMLKSKKFWYAISALLVAVVGHIKPEWAATVEQMIYGIIALILGQGVADLGKSAKLLDKTE